MVAGALEGWPGLGIALAAGLVVGWAVRSWRARGERVRLVAEADSRFVEMFSEAEVVRREAAQIRLINEELSTEVAGQAASLAALHEQLTAQRDIATQFRADAESARLEIERAREDRERLLAEAQARQSEHLAEGERELARVKDEETRLAKANEAAQAERAILTTELIDLRRRAATAVDVTTRLTRERDALERERERLVAELSRREAEVRVAVVAQQAAFAEFRTEIGSLRARADRAEGLRGQLEDRENLLRSVLQERDNATRAVAARERELAEARAALSRERENLDLVRDREATHAERVTDLESRIAAGSRARERLETEAIRSSRELETLREEIKDRDVRFRALLEDRRAVVEASLAEMARLRREITSLSAAGRTGETRRDDLRRISGIGPAIERMLQAQGVTSLEQIARWNEEDIDRVSSRLGAFRDRIRRERWVAQAQQVLGDTEQGVPVPRE